MVQGHENVVDSDDQFYDHVDDNDKRKFLLPSENQACLQYSFK